jgi:4-hydroxy-3-polyprenylbenzoate decarboxylase
MPPFGLRSFLVDLEVHRELKRVRAEVDPRFEIAEIAQRTVREEGPALLFEHVKGSPYPLAINMFGTFPRIERALGMHPEALASASSALPKSSIHPRRKRCGTRAIFSRGCSPFVRGV